MSTFFCNHACYRSYIITGCIIHFCRLFPTPVFPGNIGEKGVAMDER